LPNVLELIAWIGTQPQLVLETGHVTPQEGLMVIREARARGVRQVVVTHAPDLGWTVPQMREAAAEGAYLEFVYHSTLGRRQAEKLKTYAETIKAVGPRHCIMATDLGDVPPGTNYPLEPQGFLEFMQAMHKQGIPVADINLMTKANPARALGLDP
jgi:predicted TIM-barrel fold metal-dependent hydrolase